MASQLLLIRLKREETSVPWGFRLEGGVDIGHRVNIAKVTPGSIADRSGLRTGDYVVRINNSNTNWMRHDDAKMEITRSGNDIEMLVERGAVHCVQASAPVTMMPSNYQVRVSPNQTVCSTSVWKPQLIQPQPVTSSYYTEPRVRTSLEVSHENYNPAIGVSHNVSPIPFGHSPPNPGQTIVAQGTDGRLRQIKHSSYNSPMGLYAERNKNETFQRTISSAVSSQNNRFAPRPAHGAMPRDPASGAKYCGSCGGFISNVFVKVQGRVPMHPECLKCCKCGVGLRNVGYFYINDRLYCERHAKQAAPPPEPGMKPVVVYK